MTDTIVFNTVIAELEAIVAEKGEDYVYPDTEKVSLKLGHGPTYQQMVNADPDDEDATLSCVYFDVETRTEPRCIVGVWLDKRGITLDDIESSMPSSAQYAGVESIVRALTVDGKLPALTTGALDALYNAQTSQDAGNTWGESLERAKKL